MFAGGNVGNMMDLESPNPLMMSRYDPTTGRQDIRFMCRPYNNFDARLNAHYLTADPKDSQVHLETEYQGDDYILGGKMGLGLDMVSFNYT